MALWWWVVSAGVSWCHKCGGNITELRTFSWVNPSKRPCSPKKNAQKDSRKSKERSRSFLSHRRSFEQSKKNTLESRWRRDREKTKSKMIVMWSWSCSCKVTYVITTKNHLFNAREASKSSMERSRSFEVKEERTWITMTSQSWKKKQSKMIVMWSWSCSREVTYVITTKNHLFGTNGDKLCNFCRPYHEKIWCQSALSFFSVIL
jgi:hypothetical protein